MRFRKVYMENSESHLVHTFVGSQSMCGQVDLRKTRTIFDRISRARVEKGGFCKKCQAALERDRRTQRMEALAEFLANRRREA